MTSHLLGLAVANLCFLAAGAGVGRALGLWRAPRDLPGALAPVYLVGVAVSGIAAKVRSRAASKCRLTESPYTRFSTSMIERSNTLRTMS